MCNTTAAAALCRERRTLEEVQKKPWSVFGAQQLKLGHKDQRLSDIYSDMILSEIARERFRTWKKFSKIVIRS